MTTINCSENCIYQKDGKCSFENICMQTIHANFNCAYFVENTSNLLNDNTNFLKNTFEHE